MHLVGVGTYHVVLGKNLTGDRLLLTYLLGILA